MSNPAVRFRMMKTVTGVPRPRKEDLVMEEEVEDERFKYKKVRQELALSTLQGQFWHYENDILIMKLLMATYLWIF